MTASLNLQPVTLLEATADRDGVLVFIDGLLAAILVRLDDEAHDTYRGHWYLEVAFGGLDPGSPMFFPGLDSATEWITRRARPGNIVAESG